MGNLRRNLEFKIIHTGSQHQHEVKPGGEAPKPLLSAAELLPQRGKRCPQSVVSDQATNNIALRGLKKKVLNLRLLDACQHTRQARLKKSQSYFRMSELFSILSFSRDLC